jgi:hypothetical protein
MPQNISLLQLQFQIKRLDLFVEKNFSLTEQRSVFMSIELVRLKLEQFLNEEKEQSTQEPDEVETQLFQASDFQNGTSIMKEIRHISNQLDQTPFDHSLWQKRADLWEVKGDQVAMQSDLLRVKTLEQQDREREDE